MRSLRGVEPPMPPIPGGYPMTRIVSVTAVAPCRAPFVNAEGARPRPPLAQEQHPT